jgi:predicted transcriptional regulator
MRRAVDSQVIEMPEILLYPRDTVLRALEAMHRYGVHLLPVVDEKHGEVLGHVSEEELHRIWHKLPLARMSELLTARAALAWEGIADKRSSRLVFIPEGQGSRSSWLH